MTTQALAQAINLRHELPLEDLLQFAPQLAGHVRLAAITLPAETAIRPHAYAERAFWTTFTFGCMQALVLFTLIYTYFAH